MKYSLKKGLSFGSTSAIITTLGLIIGLYSGTQSELVIIGGILTIMIADSLSDSLAIHVSEEATDKYTAKQVWRATFFTLFFKSIFAASFVIPILLFPLQIAIIVCIIWGALLLAVSSFYIARARSKKPLKIVAEHLLIAAIVVISTSYLGQFIREIFK